MLLLIIIRVINTIILGILLEKSGRLDDAKLYYDKAIELNPTYAPAYNNKAYKYDYFRRSFRKIGENRRCSVIL